MKKIGTTPCGDFLIEMSKNEFEALDKLHQAVSGRTINEASWFREPSSTAFDLTPRSRSGVVVGVAEVSGECSTGLTEPPER